MFIGCRVSVLHDEKVLGNFVDQCHPNKLNENGKKKFWRLVVEQ